MWLASALAASGPAVRGRSGTAVGSTGWDWLALALARPCLALLAAAAARGRAVSLLLPALANGLPSNRAARNIPPPPPMLRRLFDGLKQPRLPARELQRDLDVYRLAILTTYRLTGGRGGSGGGAAGTGLGSSETATAAENSAAHRATLQRNLEAQLRLIVPLSEPPGSGREMGGMEGLDDPVTSSLEMARQQMLAGLGYTLETRPSSVRALAVPLLTRALATTVTH
eukprot:COSAG01_NODE_2381_length_7792_cov_5.907578_4_plen_227_part_00